MFSVFSCVRSFRSRSDVVLADSTWGRLSAVWAIGYSDWRCVSESAQCVWEGQNTVCASVIYALRSIISCLWSFIWSTHMRLAVIMSVQEELICVCLVMPRCMISIQLFLSEIVLFWLKVKRVACKNLLSIVFNTRATRLLHLAQAQNVHATVELAARQSGVFNATFLLNGSDNRQQSGWRVVR